MTTKIGKELIAVLCHLSKNYKNMTIDKDIELEIIELLDLAKSIKSRIAGFASKDHKHDEYATKEHEHDGYATKEHKHTDYAAKEHEHDGYALKEHKHTDYAAKEHEHDGYAAKEHSHPELEQLIADSVAKVFFLTTGAELSMVEDQMQPIILTHTGATPKHLYDFFTKTARFNCPNYIVAPGKTFAARICLHQGTLFVLSDGIITD